VVSDAEWTALTDFLGGEVVAGGKLKETGTTHWITPNFGSTNETGFTALPGGFRLPPGTFYSVGSQGYWWSSTEYSTSNAWSQHMNFNISNLMRANDVNGIKRQGYSVRCLRD